MAIDYNKIKENNGISTQSKSNIDYDAIKVNNGIKVTKTQEDLNNYVNTVQSPTYTQQQPTQTTIQPTNQATFKTLEEAQNYAKANNIKVSNTVATPKIDERVMNTVNSQRVLNKVEQLNPNLYDKSVDERGNAVTQSLMKLQNFAKDNNLTVSNNNDNDQIVKELYGQAQNLSEDKKNELLKYIYTYNTKKDEAIKNSSYLGNRLKSGLVSSVGGIGDAVVGMADKKTNDGLQEMLDSSYYRNNVMSLKEAKQQGLSVEEYHNKINQYVDERQQERDQASNEHAQNSLKKNVFGEMAQVLAKDQAKIEKAQNVGKVEKFVGDVASGMSGMLPTILISATTGNPQLGLAVMSSSAGGNGYRQAINEGASEEDAFAYGTLMALKEYTTEKMFGAMNKMAGFDVKGYGDEFLDSIVNKMFEGSGNTILQGFANFAVGGLGEGLEEFVGSLVEPYIKNLTLGTNEKADLKEALYEGLVGAFTGMAMGGPNAVVNLNNDIQTQKSNKAIDNMIQQKAEERLKNKTISYDNVVNKGNINQETNVPIQQEQPTQAVNEPITTEQTQPISQLQQDVEAYNFKAKKEPSYKTNVERDSGVIEQRIKQIEEGKVERVETGNKTSKTEIKKIIEDSIGQKLFTKNFRQKAYGIYKPGTDTIRLAESSDIETALHELGHKIDHTELNKISKKTNSEISKELIELCETAFPKIYKQKITQLSEGFAEATRKFIVEPQEFAKNYPNTSALILNELENNQNLNKLFNSLTEKVNDYVNMSAEDRVLSNVSMFGEDIQKEKLTKDKIKDKLIEFVFDDTIALKRVQEKIANEKGVKLNDLSPSDNFYMMLKMADGLTDASITSLRDGYEENGVKKTEGLANIMSVIKNNEELRHLTSLMIAEGNQDYVKANKKTGIRQNDALNVIEQYKGSKYEKASKQIREINNYGLERLRNSGMLTNEQIKTMKKVNELYVPMNRVIEQDGKINVGKKSLQNGTVIKGRKGSDRTIINPIESTITNNLRIDRQVLNNECLKTFMKSLEGANILGEFVDVIPAPMQFKGSATLENFKTALENQGVDTSDLDLETVYNIFSPKLSDDKQQIMSYMEDGKRIYIQFKDKGVYNAINGLTQQGSSAIEKFMSVFNGALKFGATAGNIAFAIPNAIADSQTAFLNSDATFVPILDSLVGVVDTLAGSNDHSIAQKFIEKIAPKYVETKKQLYNDYVRSGAKTDLNRYSGLGKGRTDVEQTMRALNLDYKTLYGKNKIPNVFKGIVNILEWIPELSEEATRFRNFEKEYKSYQKQGMGKENAIKKAGYNARRVTQDFGQSGTLTKAVNKVKPFTSARVGGLYQAYENFKANPVRYGTRVAILTALSSTIEALLANRMGNDDEYEELQDQKRLDNYTIPIGDGKVVTIKKIQGPVRQIINLAEMAVDYAMGKIDDEGLDKRFDAIIGDSIKDMLWFSSDTDAVPQALKPLIENATNTDLYYGNRLIPQSMENLDNKNKYNENTSETAKTLGSILNYPPIYIDNMIEGYLAGVGKQMTSVSDSVINMFRDSEKGEVPEKDITDKSILSRFFADINNNAQSVNELYDKYDKLLNDKAEDRLSEEDKKVLESIEQGKDTLSRINKQIKEIKVDSVLNGKEKKEKINELKTLKTDTARYYLGKDLINEENKDKIELYEFYPSSSKYTITNKATKYELNLTNEDTLEYANLFRDTYNLYLEDMQKSKTYKEATEKEKEELEKKIKDKARDKTTTQIKSNILKRDYSK